MKNVFSEKAHKIWLGIYAYMPQDDFSNVVNAKHLLYYPKSVLMRYLLIIFRTRTNLFTVEYYTYFFFLYKQIINFKTANKIISGWLLLIGYKYSSDRRTESSHHLKTYSQ